MTVSRRPDELHIRTASVERRKDLAIRVSLTEARGIFFDNGGLASWGISEASANRIFVLTGSPSPTAKVAWRVLRTPNPQNAA